MFTLGLEFHVEEEFALTHNVTSSSTYHPTEIVRSIVATLSFFPTICNYDPPNTTINMKLAIVAFLAAATMSSVSAFAPAASFARAPTMAVFSDKTEEEEGLDLNLEEMFDM